MRWKTMLVVALLVLLSGCGTCQELFDLDRQPHPEEVER